MITAISGYPTEMSQRTQSALHALFSSIVLGIIGDFLFFQAETGLNVLLWTLALITCGAILRQRNGLIFGRELTMTSILILFFASGLCWRDSRVLRAIDIFGWMTFMALLLWQTRGGTLSATTVFRWFNSLGDAAGSQIAGFIHLLSRDVQWAGMNRRRLTNAPAVARGLIVAIPLVFIFGFLFASADPVFDYFANKLFHWDLENVISHAILIGACTWAAGGPLRALAFERPQPPHTDTPTRVCADGQIEANIILATLNVLFTIFVLVQIQYLFGGEARVLAAKITYSDYARRGFFELVTVAVLVLPLLLAIDSITDSRQPRRLIRSQSLGLILLLFVIMASAFKRMSIYTAAYGLTELRLYTTAFMLWLALTFGWLAFSVLRGRRKQFLIGALMSGVAAIAVLHIINPDRLIVQTNISRATRGASFDIKYAASLSADAILFLVKSAGQLPAQAASELRTRLATRSVKGESDWRSFNWSRHDASLAMEEFLNAH